MTSVPGLITRYPMNLGTWPSGQEDLWVSHQCTGSHIHTGAGRILAETITSVGLAWNIAGRYVVVPLVRGELSS